MIRTVICHEGRQTGLVHRLILALINLKHHGHIKQWLLCAWGINSLWCREMAVQAQMDYNFYTTVLHFFASFSVKIVIHLCLESAIYIYIYINIYCAAQLIVKNCTCDLDSNTDVILFLNDNDSATSISLFHIASVSGAWEACFVAAHVDESEGWPSSRIRCECCHLLM